MEENLIKKGEDLRNNVLATMNSMLAFVKRYPKANLPSPDKKFVLAKTLLEKEQFTLAVCGKVKNGKSSLINALIGRELLPVASDVATSRAFEISNSDKDSFYVVYANGDKKQITESDLAKYGSQKTIDEEGMVDSDKTIAYIEVNTKIEMLPKGVVLVDTPGIGATYPQHTAITKQFLSMADAALFVANPTPLEKLETEFLKDVAAITPYILFVTTKIDENGTESVDEAIAKNEQLIEKAIGDKLAEKPKMLRMSSKQLLEAAQETDKESSEFQIMISGFEEVKEEMQRIIYKAQGYYRTGEAYNEAVGYYQSVLKSLKNRIEATNAAAKNFNELLAQYEQNRKVFVEKLGDSKRKSVLNDVEVILSTMSADFTKMFSPSGEIYKKYDEEINSLTIDSINAYTEGLGNRIVTDLQKAWENLASMAQKRMNERLEKYNIECHMAMPESIRMAVDGTANSDPSVSPAKFKDSIMAMRSEMFLGTAFATAFGTLATGAAYLFPAAMVPLAPVLAPVFIAISVGAVLWGAFGGRQKAKAEKLKKNKKELLVYVQETISSCRKQLIDVSLNEGKYESLYQGFCNAVRQQAQQTVTAIYDKYHKELEAMKNTIAEAKTNPKIIEALEYMTKEWEKNKTSLLSEKKDIDMMSTI